jgi:hypothetical protein
MSRGLSKPGALALAAAMSIAFAGPQAVAQSDIDVDTAAAAAGQAADRIALERGVGSGEFHATGGTEGQQRVRIALPKDHLGAVQIGSGATGVLMDLPNVGATRAEQATDGSTVRDGARTDLVLRDTAASAQIMTLLEDASSPSAYTYRFRGAELSALADGRVAVSRAETTARGSVVAKVVALIDVPWAVDAKGVQLTTSYSVRGEYLTQHIDTSGAAFPVVADPSVKREKWIPLTFVVTLNPADQRIIISSGGAAVGAAVGALMCAAGGPASAVCAAAGALIITAVAEAFKEYGVKEGCNWHARWVLAEGVTDTWRSGRC